MKQIIKLLFILVSLTITMVLSSLVVVSAPIVAPNVILSSQNPDPVSPGNFVFLNVKISNSGSVGMTNTSIRFEENSLFSLAEGSKRARNIGTIPPSSRDEDQTGFVIAKYKLRVAEDAPLGLNTAKFRVDSSHGSSAYEFEVLVQDTNPKIQITDFKVPTTKAGETTTITITLENTNSIALKDVFVALKLGDVDGKVISMNEQSNERVISQLDAGESKELKYSIIVSPDAASKPFLIPVNISFEDTLDVSYSKEVFGTIQVYSDPLLSFNLDSQSIYSIGKGTFTFSVANPGTSTIKGTEVEILSTEKYTVLEGRYNYIGDLNPDDFQTLQAQVAIEDEEVEFIQVKLSYLDSYNKKQEEIKEIPLSIYSADEREALGLNGASSSGGSGWLSFFLLILIVVALFGGRKWGYKRAKKKFQKN